MIKVYENEEFLSLILAAEDDNKFRNRILDILRVAEPERNILLKDLIAQSKLHGAPQGFLDALKLLLDDRVARQVIEILINQ